MILVIGIVDDHTWYIKINEYDNAKAIALTMYQDKCNSSGKYPEQIIIIRDNTPFRIYRIGVDY